MVSLIWAQRGGAHPDPLLSKLAVHANLKRLRPRMSAKRSTPSSSKLAGKTCSTPARKIPPSASGSETDSLAAELAAQLNLGPKSAQALVAAGITSLAELRSLGSVAAYARIKQKTPQATLNLLWALEGALSSLPWQTVAQEHRTSLLLALEQYQNGG